jgi:pimeloyl-ACP methyl ester carboxylesterase
MHKTKTVKLRGGRVQTVHTVGKGPTVIWLHGPHGVRKLDPVIAALAQRYTVVAPVAPGFNDVDELAELRNVHDLALHYDDLLTALGLDHVTLIGHSFGAMVAAEVAAHFPKRVKRLVLISPIGLWRDDHPVADLFAQPFMTFDKMLWKGGVASGPMADPANEPSNPVEKTVSVVQALTTVANFIWPIPDKGLRRRLPRVTAPTLVIFGADDAFVPAIYADEFKSAIRGARRIVVEGAAHMVPYEKTSDVVSKISAWLGGGKSKSKARPKKRKT